MGAVPWANKDGDFGSENAVDGMYTDRSVHGGQCTISDDGKYTATWEEDLGKVVSISHINIYYKTDNSGMRSYFSTEIHFDFKIFIKKFMFRYEMIYIKQNCIKMFQRT